MASVTVNAAVRNFTTIAGDKLEFPLQFFADERGAVPEDITGWTGRLTVKKDIEDDDDDAVFDESFNPLEALTGKITLTMTSADTLELRGEHVYAVAIYDGSGSRNTNLSGTLTFTAPVRQAL